MTSSLLSNDDTNPGSFVTGQIAISIFADSDEGRIAARLAAQAAGARLIFESAIDDDSEWLDRPYFGDAMLIEIERDSGARLEAFLNRVDGLSRADGLAVVANATPDCLDVVAARLEGAGVAILSQATLGDRIAALTMARASPAPVLRETGSDDALQLQRLADEVGRIARTLADMAGSEPATASFGDGLIGYRAEPADAEMVDASYVRGIIRLRRMRERYFRGELFADPAWDMLLDLMAARLERLRVAVSSLCIASAVPATTALRWSRR